MKGLYYTLGALALVAVIVAVSAIFARTSLVATGSVTPGGEYTSAQITSSNASGTATTQLKTYAGTFGSVVVTAQNIVATGGYPSLTVYDATSTMATATSRVLAKFSTTTGQGFGTYQFDTAFSYGLQVEVPVGFNGVYTLTFR